MAILPDAEQHAWEICQVSRKFSDQWNVCNRLAFPNKHRILPKSVKIKRLKELCMNKAQLLQFPRV